MMDMSLEKALMLAGEPYLASDPTLVARAAQRPTPDPALQRDDRG